MPILSVPSIYFVRACGVRVVFLENGALEFLQVVSLHLKSGTSLTALFAFCSEVNQVYLSPEELLTWRAASVGELNQGLSSIRTFVRPNKRNDSRWRQSWVLCRRPCCLRCSTLLSREIAAVFRTKLKENAFEESVDKHSYSMLDWTYIITA